MEKQNLEPFSLRLHCQHVKRDGSICGRNCYRPTGCSLHWKLQLIRDSRDQCKICEKRTSSYTGYCSNHAGRFYAYDYRVRQKNTPIDPTLSDIT